MIARQSASNRATFSMMLSSTMKMARAPRAARVGDVGEHAVEAEGLEVAAAHLDDRAEAAVVGAAARRLDDIDGPAEEGVAAEHARGTIRQRDRPVVQTADVPRRLCRNRWPSWIESPGIDPRRRRDRARAHAADRETSGRLRRARENRRSAPGRSYSSGARLGS